MKQYPYSDSTDVVIYDNSNSKKKDKKNRKPKTWVVAVSSALAASIFTVGITFGVQALSGGNVPLLDTTTAGTTAANTNGSVSSPGSATTTAYTDESGKEVLTVPEIAAKVGPAVVGVINKTTVTTQQYWDPWSGRYYYSQDPSQDNNETVEQGSGSGIIISEDGYIVTNQHVIDGATEVDVILNTGTTYTAEIIGQDEKTDLAVLKITPENETLTVAVLGDSTTVQVGELAVAIGNPMGMEFAGSVTAGIVSAVNRTMTIDNRTYNLIQTDAAINSGNSGGALINQYGEVIGINSVKLSSSDVEGMGFAIAISEAKPIINDLMQSGHVTGRPLVGISISETRYGLFISGISEGSGAEAAGLQVNDMILEVDGQAVSSTSEINEIRDEKKPGDYLTFKILRDSNTMEISVQLTEDTGTSN